MNNKTDLNQIRPDHMLAPAEVSASLDLEANTILDVGSGCMNLSLIYPEGCGGGCSYCFLGSGMTNDSAANCASEHGWALYSVDEMIAHVTRNRDILNRVCISTTMHPSSFDDAFFLVERVSRDLDLPVSVKINPPSVKAGDPNLFRDAGADKVAFVLDSATENLFIEHRCKSVDGACAWNTNWDTLKEAAFVFGSENTFCQLISGLGETERQLLEATQNAHDIGAMTNLFPFYPDDGSLLEGVEPCPTGQFRRMQLASFLIDSKKSTMGDMQFDEEDRVVSFGLKGKALECIVDSGRPLKTNHHIGVRPCARVWRSDNCNGGGCSK